MSRPNGTGATHCDTMRQLTVILTGDTIKSGGKTEYVARGIWAKLVETHQRSVIFFSFVLTFINSTLEVSP